MFSVSKIIFRHLFISSAFLLFHYITEAQIAVLSYDFVHLNKPLRQPGILSLHWPPDELSFVL